MKRKYTGCIREIRRKLEILESWGEVGTSFQVHFPRHPVHTKNGERTLRIKNPGKSHCEVKSKNVSVSVVHILKM